MLSHCSTSSRARACRHTASACSGSRSSSRLHAVSDAVIALSYFSIPLALGYCALRRRDITFGWMLWLFGDFILACGTTHSGIWNFWHADYGAEGLVKAVTALASAGTAIALWPLVARVLEVPTPAQFREVADQLATETGEREHAQRALRRSEESLRLLIDGVTDYAHLHARPRAATSPAGTPAPSGIKGYRKRRDHRPAFFRFYTEEDGAAAVPARALATAAQRRHVRGGGLARPQGRHALLGERRHRRRSATTTAHCSASPRSPATSPSGGRPQQAAGTGPRSNCCRRRRWRRSASSPAASRTTSTTC